MLAHPTQPVLSQSGVVTEHGAGLHDGAVRLVWCLQVGSNKAVGFFLVLFAKGNKALHGEKSYDTVLLTLSSLDSTLHRRCVSKLTTIGFRLKVFLTA